MALVGSISGSAGQSIGVTGSVIFSNRAGSDGSLFPAAIPGGDVYFFVSGSTAGKNDTTSRTVALFGGDTVVSGSLTIGTGSIRIDSNEIRFQGGLAKIYSGTSGLTFEDSGGTRTLAQIIAGGGGGGSGTNFFLDTAGAGKIYTTASSVAFPFGESGKTQASDKGSDVKFYVSGSGQVVGFAGSTVSLFGGNIVTSGSLEVKDSGATGATTVRLSNAGDISVEGNIDTLTAENKTLFASAGAFNVTIGGSTSTVVVPGNLTVNGTTTTVNTDNLLVRDAIIVMASGTAGPNKPGGIAIFSGSNGGGTPDLVFGQVANDVWGAGKASTNNGTVSTLTDMTLVPLRAGEFQIGGSTAFVSSSNSADLIINSNIITTFSKAGTTPLVRITELNTGEGAIFGAGGTFASPTISRLWLSGTNVQLAHSLADSNNSIDIVGNNQRAGSLRVTLAGLTPTLNIEAKDGGSVSRALIITGSIITLGSNDARGTVQFVKQGGTPSLTISADGSNNSVVTASGDFNLRANGNDIRFLGNSTNTFLTFTNDSDNAVISGYSTNGNVTLGTSGSGVTTISGSDVNFKVAGTGTVRFQRHATDVLHFSANTTTTPVLSASVANAEFRIGTSGGSDKLFLSGTNVGVNAGPAGFKIYRDSNTTAFANISAVSSTEATFGVESGVTTANVATAFATTVNFAAGGSTARAVNLGTGDAAQTVTVGSTNTTSTLNLQAGTGRINSYSHVVPSSNNSLDLGAPDLRWRNMYTGDLHLKNERGNWTIIEEEDYLSITNNINGKRYKFVLEEI